MNYPLAPNGIFLSIQGEGALVGLPMVFVRLAGCDVNCLGCDTDYRLNSRASAEAIAATAVSLRTPAVEYVWVTGGEPTIHDLDPLVASLRRAGFRVALATAGHRRVTAAVDYLSVSPHDPSRWVQRWGTELKLVAGLGGLRLADCAPILAEGTRFDHFFAQPVEGDAAAVRECMQWVSTHAGWRMSGQLHKAWGLA